MAVKTNRSKYIFERKEQMSSAVFFFFFLSFYKAAMVPAICFTGLFYGIVNKYLYIFFKGCCFMFLGCCKSMELNKHRYLIRVPCFIAIGNRLQHFNSSITMLNHIFKTIGLNCHKNATGNELDQ